MKKRMKKKRKNFNTIMSEGDAVIRIRENKTVELVFAEDTETVIREMAWPEHEVYKTAVQFALMIDSFLKNGEGLDNIILNSATGNIAVELMSNDTLPILLSTAKNTTTEQKEKVEVRDNILDLTSRLKRKEDNDTKR